MTMYMNEVVPAYPHSLTVIHFTALSAIRMRFQIQKPSFEPLHHGPYDTGRQNLFRNKDTNVQSAVTDRSLNGDPMLP